MRKAVIGILVAAAALAAAGAGSYAFYRYRLHRLPDTIVMANGRIEVERVDVASKVPGRIARVLVREGDLVEGGQVVALMDMTEIEAQLAAARASIDRAVHSVARSEAEAASRQAELVLAELELKRSMDLRDRSVNAQADVDKHVASRNVASAAVKAAEAAINDAKAAQNVAVAQAAQIEATIADMTLKAPVAGRVEYKMVQTGEVVNAGAKVVTLLDLSDVYMTIFLPTRSVGRVRYGSPARLLLDAAPDYPVPASVSFVAAEAQFTPKTVETSEEREKLMYRVKVQVPQELLQRYRDYVKAGLTGNAYVALGPDVAWPDWLQPRRPDGAP